MKKYKQLLEERAALFAKQTAIVELVKNEDRELTKEEEARFDDLEEQMKGMVSSIKRAKIIYDNELRKRKEEGVELTALSSYGVGGSEEREKSRMRAKYDLHKAIRSQLQNFVLDGVEREIHEETLKRASDVNVNITGLAVPTDFISESRSGNGQTVTKDSGAFGANLVDTRLQSPIEFLRPDPILERLGARFMSGLTGNLKFPVNKGGIVGSWEGEVDSSQGSENSYGDKEMSPKRHVTSVKISLQNLMQSSIDLQKFTVDDIRQVTSNALDYAGINGPGVSGVPLGILNSEGVNTVSAGVDGAKPTWSHIVDLETSINDANAGSESLAYLINSVTKGVLKKTKHGAGDLNYLMSGSNEINGYNAGISNLVPRDLSKGSGSNLSAGIFGDFSQLLIGQWAFLDLTVDSISLKKRGYIELIVNSFLDTMVRQPKAFSVIKDWKI